MRIVEAMEISDSVEWEGIWFAHSLSNIDRGRSSNGVRSEMPVAAQSGAHGGAAHAAGSGRILCCCRRNELKKKS